MESLKLLTANKLKIIAVVTMFFDHFVSVFFPHNAMINLVFRVLGRTAAPVFCFFIAQGYHYTSDLKKYITRLLIFAMVSHLPYNLAFGFGLSPLSATSVIWSLAMGLIALAAIKNDEIHVVFKALILAVCCLLAWTANWFFIGVLWVVAFGLFHGNFKRQIAAFCAIGVLYMAWNLRRFGLFDETFPQWFQLGIFLSIPLLMMYNGKIGKKSKAMTWLFYVFYPAHLILLYLLNNFTPLNEFLGGLF